MKRKNENKFISKLTEYRMAVSTRRIRIVASMQPTDDGQKLTVTGNSSSPPSNTSLLVVHVILCM